MGRVQRRRDGSDFYVEGFGDRAVVEVEVVAEKDGVTLPLRKAQNRLPNRRTAFVGGGHGGGQGLGTDVLRRELRSGGGTIQVLGGVDDASRNPRFKQS